LIFSCAAQSASKAEQKSIRHLSLRPSPMPIVLYSAQHLKNRAFQQAVKLWKLPTESSILRSGFSLTVLESSSKAAIAVWGR
jgi:hypothetical protein